MIQERLKHHENKGCYVVQQQLTSWKQDLFHDATADETLRKQDFLFVQQQLKQH